jgi:hypothetical protein
MVELFGSYKPWSREVLKEVTNRIIKEGAEITVCRKELSDDKTPVCWINKYHSNPVKIHYHIAQVYLTFGLVGIDSGNFDTGEDHYTYFVR